MRPVTLTTSNASGGTVNSSVCPMNLYAAVFLASLSVIVTGVATYSVQYTLDDVFSSSFNPATANWTDVAGMSGGTTSAEATVDSPVRGIRLSQTAGAGSVSLRIAQSGLS